MTIRYYVGVTPPSTQTRVGFNKYIIAQSLDEVLQTLNKMRVITEDVIVYVGEDQLWLTKLGPLELRANLFFVGTEYTVLDSGTLQAGTTAAELELEGTPTDDAFYGKTVEITSGAAEGFRRTIRDNEGATATPSWGFHIAPSDGDTYRITEPTVSLRCRLTSNADPPNVAYPPVSLDGVGTPLILGGTRGTYTAAPAVYFINLKLDREEPPPSPATGGWSFVGSNVVLLGTELPDLNLLATDDGTMVWGGVDFPYRVAGPTVAGLVDNTEKWVGWGFNSEPLFASANLIQRFYGFGTFRRVRLENGVWWWIGGGAIASTSAGSENYTVIAEERSYIVFGEWMPIPEAIPVLIRNTTDTAWTGCVDCGGGSQLSFEHATLRKTNQGYALGIYGDEHSDLSPCFVSLSGDSGLCRIEAVAGNTTPDYGVVIHGGSRLNFHDAYTVFAGTWDEAEFGIWGLRVDTNPPEYAVSESDFTEDGFSFVAADGTVVQRH